MLILEHNKYFGKDHITIYIKTNTIVVVTMFQYPNTKSKSNHVTRIMKSYLICVNSVNTINSLFNFILNIVKYCGEYDWCSDVT